MSCTPWRRALGAAVLVLLMGSRVMSAQAAGVEQTQDFETRAALEAEAKKAEAQHRTSEAWILNTRLKRGDFQDGDKILLKLLGTTTMLGAQPGNDTVTVRAGKMLPLPQMADLPLEGVLRSELTAKISSHLAQYLKDSSVRATPLVRLSVLGQVRVPGFYYTPTDVLLSELIMKAGGPLPTADLGNMVIKRGADVIWTAQDTRTALADGISLERLHLRAGDEVYLDDMKGTIDWRLILQVGVSTLGTLLTLIYAFRRF